MIAVFLVISALILYRKRIERVIVRNMEMVKQDWRGWLWLKWKDWGEPLLIALVLAFLIRTFLIGPYKIPTGSMEPTLMIGDRIFVDKITYRFRGPKRGEVVVFKYPQDRKKDFVKRLIGFGREEVEIREGMVFVDGTRVREPDVIESTYYYNRNDWDYGKEGQRIKVPSDNLFVLGDNSGHSSDSRYWGFVPKKDVRGKAVLIWWPPRRVGLIR